MMIYSYLLSFLKPDTDISEEKLEEYKTTTGILQKDIIRLRKLFLQLTNGSEIMTKSVFISIEGIALSPLLDRICDCFGLIDDSCTLTFESFLTGVAAFNAPGHGEVKLKTAFHIQDFDNDGKISKKDLTEYITRVTSSGLKEDELEEIVNEVFRETSSDPQQDFISYGDFQRVVFLLDFQAKLHLPI